MANEKTKLLRVQNWLRYSFSRKSKLRLDEFGVKFSRQGFQLCSTPPPVPRASYSSYSLVSFASYSRRKRSDGRHAHAATTFRVQKLCLWAEKIYRLRADIAGPVCSICLESPFEMLAREIHLAVFSLPSCCL